MFAQHAHCIVFWQGWRGGGRIGLAAHAPILEAECVLYCFFIRDGGGGHGSWLAPGRLGEGVFINREQ